MLDAHWIRHTGDAIAMDQLVRVHSPDYIADFFSNGLSKAASRRIGFPWSQDLVERTQYSVGGTLKTLSLALKHQVACHLGGGYHHAFAEYGGGFCIFNDLVVAADAAINQGWVDKILIVDCDVHQGDGTAKMAEHRDDIITYSIHAEANYPAKKQSSDIDVPLQKGTQDSEYLTTLEQTLTLAIQLHQPDLIIYDAGVDIHTDDELGYLDVTSFGVYQRDKTVLELCHSRNIPVATVVGGGYQRDLNSLCKLHFGLFKAVEAVYSKG